MKSSLYNELKELIRANNIKTRKELDTKFSYKYKKFCSCLTEEEKEELLPKLELGTYTSLKTKEDFQNYIDDHKVKSNSDFYRDHVTVYDWCRELLTKEERNSLKFEEMPVRNDWSHLNTLEDFQNFIDTNNIKTNLEFTENYSGVYTRYLKVVPKESRGLKFPPAPVVIDPFDKLDGFQKYIDDNGIQTCKEFRKEHKTMYAKYLDKRKNWSDTKLRFPIESNVDKFKDLNTNEDFQKYLDEHGIKSRREFRAMGSLASRYYKVVPEDQRDLKFEEEGHHIYRKEFSTVEDFQKFIDEKGIFRPVDFRNDYPKIYDRFCRIIPKDKKHELVYGIDKSTETKRRSYGERYLIQLLTNNNIEFVSEKIFPDLKKKSYLRYDLYLPDYNVLIEYHGIQHFNTDTMYSSEELIENDKRKYEYAIESGMRILYFTLHKSALEEFGYFAEVITDSKILIEEIKRN